MILSGHDTPTFVQRAVRAGAQGFVSKTQDISEIVRGVEAILSGYSVFPVTSGTIVAPLVGELNEQAKLELLSDKELIVLQMLAKGMSNKSIGEALFITDKTVSTYKARLREKLGLSSLAGMIEFATHHKLID
jgi:two-component system response regulator EvgA